jgi:hypothetical protein
MRLIEKGRAAHEEEAAEYRRPRWQDAPARRWESDRGSLEVPAFLRKQMD